VETGTKKEIDMAGWVKLEKRKITQRKDDAIYRTKVVGFEWFDIAKAPECYKVDQDDCMWIATSDYHFGKDKPE